MHLEAIFKLKVTEELYNDELRMKCAVIAVYPIDYAAEAKKIIEGINKLMQ
jgi:hypothetical protein